MTDFLRSILQTAHNASTAPAPAAAATIKTEVQPIDQIQVPLSACTDATASLRALENQHGLKVEAVVASPGATTDVSKAQRAVRRDVVNARRENTKRKTMSDDSDDSDCAASIDDVIDKSKKIKTSATTAVDAASIPSSSFLNASSMLFTTELDAIAEERLRAMELQLESLDPDSKEAKKKRRLIRNRMSAQLHRERKKAYVGQLEDQLLAKEREVQALQEKMQAMAHAQQQLQQQLATAPVVAAPVIEIADDVVIKAEPIEDVALAMDAAPSSIAKDNWDYSFATLDVNELALSDDATTAADELLRDFEHPFASFTAALEQEQKALAAQQPHVEIHAAKKNIVMVMGMMFSATFFGHSPFFFDVQRGSSFESFFEANPPPSDVNQLNMASKIMSSLDKSTWKDFRDIASWTSAIDATNDEEEEEFDATTAQVAASPSAASDITDSSDLCDSPVQAQSHAQQLDDCLGFPTLETDLIDEFVYPVDDPFAPALADTNWFDADDEFGQSDNDDADDDVVMAAATSATHGSSKSVAGHSPSITTRLFDKLTTLWHEKNQVLLTVLDGKNEVTSRSVADMSAIRSSIVNGSMFAAPLGAAASATASAAAAKTSPLATDQSVSFLYPLSAFSPAEESDPDVMFLEVSCQMSALSL